MIWIDLTDLSTWKGHMTGTQRVTYEVAKRYAAAAKTDVHFFVYDEKSRHFYETDFAPIAAQVAPPVTSVTPPRRRGFHKPSVKGVMKAQSLRAYRAMPFSVKQHITPAHKEFMFKSYHYASRTIGRVTRPRPTLIKAVLKDAQTVTFKSTDTVVILGKPWDTMTMIDVLRDQKMQHGFKLVHLVYDMIPSFLPQLFGYPLPRDYTIYMFEALSLTDVVIAISKSTKQDVARFCKEQLIPVPPTLVTKLGDLPAISEEAIKDVVMHDAEPGQFIVCVGTLEVRKNHALLYNAYKEGIRRGLKLPKLVIAGGPGWYTEDILYAFAHDPDLRGQVKVMLRPHDTEIAWLYRNCRFTIYPSVYEGWGLPIAESLANGKVCIASDSSSMPEIAGGLIDYFSPYDSVGCLNAIMKYMDDKTLADKEQVIAEHYKTVSWDATYKTVHGAVFGTTDSSKQ